MKLVLDPPKLQAIADNDPHTILALLARQAAAQGISLQLDEASLVELAEDDTDALGELLRAITFAGDGVGCYSTFELSPGWLKIDGPSEKILRALHGDFPDNPEEAERVEGYHNPQLGLSVYWFWDGDGHLLFDCDAFTLSNTDCKCDTGWNNIELTA